ncbi:MAG: LytTR family DNA-binding domain-containing protein [Pseudomonadota bacterium]
MKKNPEALIADDEEHLRSYLKLRLKEAWPELVIIGEARNGPEALSMINDLNPDIAFLDIKMPGMSGIEVAQNLAGRCRVVFVTAFDHYAVEAFENEAVDYLLKPVINKRLEQTVARLKKYLADDASQASPERVSAMMARLMERLGEPVKKQYMRWVTVQHRDTLRLLSVDDIACFRASEKYTTVITLSGESLINTPIKQLVLELDPELFWQIHRSTIVNVRHIADVSRSLTGRHVVRLKGVGEMLTVSRTFAHLFRQM